MDKSRNILIIDDEVEITKALARQFKRSYTVFATTKTEEAFQILKTEDIQVIISDQRMPGMTGLEFITNIKSTNPDIIKLILTGYTDIDAAISAINLNQVFRYITKPWNPNELDAIIHEAFEKYELQAKNKELTQSLAEANQDLELKVRKRTEELEEKNHELAELIKENEKNRTIIEAIFNSIPGLIFLYNDEHDLIKWNRRHLLLTGFTDKELSGKKFSDWFTDDFESLRAADTALNKMSLNGFADTELQFLKKDGNRMPIYMTASALTIAGKRYFAGIGIDITERKKMEESLMEKMKELEFLNQHKSDNELHVIDLKMEIDALLIKLGEKQKYLPTAENNKV